MTVPHADTSVLTLPRCHRKGRQAVNLGKNPVLERTNTYATFYPRVEGEEPAAPVQIDDVVVKTAAMFALLLVGAVTGWVMPILALPAMLIGLIMGLVITFKRAVVPALIIAYALVEGVFVGGISFYLNTMWPGIVSQAVLGTLLGFVSMLTCYKLGIIRVTDKFRSVMIAALWGFLALSLVSLVTMFFGVGDGWGLFGAGPLGIALCVGGIVLACLTLLLDFDDIEQATRAGLPEKEAWRLAFGLVVTVVWLYIQLLRLLAISRD
jgi:uncharacterized YccA/Bax inhibitor family protein